MIIKSQPRTIPHILGAGIPPTYNAAGGTARMAPRELLSKLLLTGTHLRNRAGATLSYSSGSTLHPQVIYAISFYAGLNGVEVD